MPKHNLSLPCSGFPLLTGREAINIMETYKVKQSMTSHAETETGGKIERLSLRDMKMMVID